MYCRQIKQLLAIPEEWTVQEEKEAAELTAPGRLDAEIFVTREFGRLQKISNDTGVSIHVGWPYCSRPFRIRPNISPMQQDKTGGIQPIQPRGVIRSAVELDWSAIYDGPNPVYINELSSQRNLYLNLSAVSAQAGKPPAQFLTETAHVLNFEEELSGRCRHLLDDNQLTEYTYEALRWFRDPDSNIWVRKRMRLISNFWKIEYLGVPCWMGEVLEAEAIRAYGHALATR